MHIRKSMHVMFLGLRGFPQVQGGVEKHAEALCPMLVELGCRVTAIARSPYMRAKKGEGWRGVRFLRIWAPKSKGLEAIVHTFLGVLAAAWYRPDILHIQAIGPGLMTPLARLLGIKVVVTHHSLNYEHGNWSLFAKWALRNGERWSMRWSHGRIVIAEWLRQLMWDKYRIMSVHIPNGVDLPVLAETTTTLERFGLTPRRYVLLVSRLVPEKRHFDLLEAFTQAGLGGWKLVFVGASDHPDEYQRKLITAAERAGAVMTGFQSGLALSELYTHAGLFVLPSSHEGLPIALLEALSYGLPVLASDIPANLEVGLPKDQYFPLGDVAALARGIRTLAAMPLDAQTVQARREWVSGKYNWRRVAEQTLEVYRSVVRQH